MTFLCVDLVSVPSDIESPWWYVAHRVVEIRVCTHAPLHTHLHITLACDSAGVAARALVHVFASTGGHMHSITVMRMPREFV